MGIIHVFCGKHCLSSSLHYFYVCFTSINRFLIPCGQWSYLFSTALLRYSSFDIHIFSWNQHCYQGNDQIYCPESCLVPLCTPSLWPLIDLISPTWGNHLSTVSRDKFTFSRVLNKCNLRVCILFLYSFFHSASLF